MVDTQKLEDKAKSVAKEGLKVGQSNLGRWLMVALFFIGFAIGFAVKWKFF